MDGARHEEDDLPFLHERRRVRLREAPRVGEAPRDLADPALFARFSGDEIAARIISSPSVDLPIVVTSTRSDAASSARKYDTIWPQSASVRSAPTGIFRNSDGVGTAAEPATAGRGRRAGAQRRGAREGACGRAWRRKSTRRESPSKRRSLVQENQDLTPSPQTLSLRETSTTAAVLERERSGAMR